MKDKVKLENAATLACATQLATDIIRKVSGNAISDTVEGVEMKDVLAGVVSAKINASLSKYKGAV